MNDLSVGNFPRRFWTTREERALRESYAAGGVEAALAALPGRSASSIYNHANKLKLVAPATAALQRPRERWTSNEQIDLVIRRAYAAPPTKGGVNRLATTVGRPRCWVSTRARQLGLVAPRFKELPWSSAELEIVREKSWLSLAALKRKLARAGFARTETAIKVKLKRIGADRSDDDRCSARQLAELLGVVCATVTGWIDKGWLTASRIDGDRTLGSGRNWSIHRRDVRRFIIDNTAAVDLRKVEKFWFVELLSGPAAGKAA
jgi:hypothetical protein